MCSLARSSTSLGDAICPTPLPLPFPVPTPLPLPVPTDLALTQAPAAAGMHAGGRLQAAAEVRPGR